jgi:hypothetical protein
MFYLPKGTPWKSFNHFKYKGKWMVVGPNSIPSHPFSLDNKKSFGLAFP